MKDIIINPEYAELKEKIKKLKNEIAELYQEKDELVYHVCKNIEAEYMSKIGILEYKLYEYYCKILRLKRKIELYQACINRQEAIDENAIEQKLDAEYRKYQEKLERMSENIRVALDRKNGTILSEEEAVEIKRIYRKLIKKLHPDLNKESTEKDKTILLQVTKAYENGDLETLRNLELLTSEIIETEDIEAGEIEELKKSKERYSQIVKNILESIKKIKETYPYNQKELLRNKDLVDKRIEELKLEMEKYKNIYAELDKIFRKLKGEDNG